MHDVSTSVLHSETLADRVRCLRLSRHMSRIELANAAGVSKSHVHQIEHGQRTRMRLSTLGKYARALGVPESYIDYGYGTERASVRESQKDLIETLRREIRIGRSSDPAGASSHSRPGSRKRPTGRISTNTAGRTFSSQNRSAQHVTIPGCQYIAGHERRTL